MSTCARPDCQRPKARNGIWCDQHGIRPLNSPTVEPIVIPLNKICFNPQARRCEKIRQNDEWFCGKCYRRWDVDDPPVSEAP